MKYSIGEWTGESVPCGFVCTEPTSKPNVLHTYECGEPADWVYRCECDCGCGKVVFTQHFCQDHIELYRAPQVVGDPGVGVGYFVEEPCECCQVPDKPPPPACECELDEDGQCHPCKTTAARFATQFANALRDHMIRCGQIGEEARAASPCKACAAKYADYVHAKVVSDGEFKRMSATVARTFAGLYMMAISALGISPAPLTERALAKMVEAAGERDGQEQ